MMSLLEARETLHNAESAYTRLYEAALAIVAAKESTIDNLLDCLRRGGIAAEIAAMKLHKLTNRPVENGWPALLVNDAEDWEAYLKSTGQR
jgi:hypothetical protein